MFDVGLETSAYQRQVIARGELLAQRPRSIYQENSLEPAVSLGRDTIDGFVKIGNIHPVVDADPESHTGVFMLQSGMSKPRQDRAIGASVVGTKGELIHGGETLDRVEPGRLEDGTVRHLCQSPGIVIPVDEVTILSVPDKIRDATRFRHHYRDAAAQGFGGGEEESFLPAVAQQDVATLQTMAITQGIEVERPDIEPIHHPQLARQFHDGLHRFTLHPESVVQARGFSTSPGPHHKTWVFGEEVGQSHQPLVFEWTSHPTHHDASLGIVIPLGHAELGHRRRENPTIHMIILVNPLPVAIHHLLRNTRHRHSPTTRIRLAEITPTRLVPGMEHQRGRSLRQALKVAVTQEPRTRVIGCHPGDLATRESVLDCPVKERHVIGLAIERGPITNPRRQCFNVTQDRCLGPSQGHIVTHEAGRNLREHGVQHGKDR